MKWFLFFYSVLISISLASALVCEDSFTTDSSTHKICGYCLEKNFSVCQPSRTCNFSVYYSNDSNIVIQNVSGINNGDGAIFYNLQNSSVHVGSYYGEMYCGPRERDALFFTISNPSSIAVPSTGGYARSSDLIGLQNQLTNITNQKKNRIPSDINNFLNNTSNRFSPKYPQVIKFSIIILFVLIIFYSEINSLRRRIKLRR